ncbi:MAG: AAA family ATPase [Burkholderiaceae bacterium]|nr:AAA family ATPase [Burkholderiaceae bacterium]
MKLQRIQLSQFRQFRDHLELADLEPGINLFHGPNESGKSTIAQAVRAAFFERHGSGTLGHLQPWGDSAAAPEVSLDFHWQGQAYQLTKRFLRQKRCYLQIGQRAFDGDEAEQHLAQLLGFEVPLRGASKPEHWGIPGLLWIEQGAGQEFRDATGHAAQHLQAALDQSVGELASSDGDAVIRKVQERMARFLTTANQAPARDYAVALKEQAALQEELQTMDQTIATYRSQVDQLDALQQQHDRDTADMPWLALRKQEQQATLQLQQAEQLLQNQKREQQALTACQATQKLVHDQLQGFEQHRLQARQREQALTAAEQASQQIELRSASMQSTLDGARADWDTASAALKQARSAQLQHSKVQELQLATASLDDMQAQLTLAQQQDQALQQQQAAALQWCNNPERLKRLQALHHELATLDARRLSVATRLEFDLEGGNSLYLDGLAVQGQDVRSLLDGGELRIPGVGRVRIIPGGQDLNALGRQHSQAQDEYDAILVALDVADLSQALTHADLSAHTQAAIDQHTIRRDAYAPQGMQALLDRVQRQQQVVQRLRQELPSLDVATGLADAGSAGSLAMAETVAAQAERDLKAAEATFHQHTVALATVRTALQTAELEHQQAQNRVQLSQAQNQEKDLFQQLNQHRAQEQELQERIAEYQLSIDTVRPDILRQDIQRFATSAQQQEQAHAMRERTILTLQAQLQAAGAQGLEEQRSVLAGRLALVQRRVDEFARNAQALKLLLGLLQGKRQELTQRLQAPLQKHLDHYVQLLFPQARLSVDENLVLSQLSRPGGMPDASSLADVDALSFGAREQLGLISRLAYADLISAAGKPTLIMLDDALVHSDAQRLGQMKRILFDAAQRHQILLFTCHPDNWRDLGVAPRPIRPTL